MEVLNLQTSISCVDTCKFENPLSGKGSVPPIAGLPVKRGSRLRAMSTSTRSWRSFRRVVFDQLIKQLSDG